MNETEMRSRLLGVVALASRYCATLENARETERDVFIAEMLDILPRLYLEFSGIDADELAGPAEYEYYPSYVDEDYYGSVRRNAEQLLGPDDVFLETFEEDMKYSDTPIAASISESLADIFQPLYNFICIVKDTDGESAPGAFRECKENFEAYWSQTLCNVMRALNHVRYNSTEE